MAFESILIIANALTMLEARDNEHRSYVELVEVLEEHSPRASEDIQEVWRRVAFSLLISNTDDHLRNHGFLRAATGWTLSPAFDLNPAPDGRGVLSTAIEDARDRSASVDLLISAAPSFRITDVGAELRRLLAGTSRWRDLAERYGVAREIPRLEPAFEHARRGDAIRAAGG